MKIPGWLRPPELKGIDELDAPHVSELHASVIRSKAFCRRTYMDFYREFKDVAHRAGPHAVTVELGSGGGFLKDVLPSVITSDVVPLPGVDQCFQADRMPFEKESLDAVFMKDVLHHMSDCRTFFRELERCLKPGGRALMIEPANTPWSRFILKNFHHEMFDTRGGWGVGMGGRLSVGNGAIPWIVFQRDRAAFEREFPSLHVLRMEPHTPFRYLVSGGLSLRQMLPSFLYSSVKFLEACVSPFNRFLGLFVTVELRKGTEP